MKNITDTIHIENIIEIAQCAGELILQVYDQHHEITYKEDASPVTIADKIADDYIITRLKEISPHIPFITEETQLTPYEIRKQWEQCWLIDPLDGTKEFIKRNGEFTVNIAFIEEGMPTLGVVHAPALNVTYFGKKGIGSYKRNKCGEDVPIQNNTHYRQKTHIRVVASRSHVCEETLQFINRLADEGKITEMVNRGSSLKICMVAEGLADVYPRFGITMEWDTAAAHAVALFAGCDVVSAKDNHPLTYNKPDLRNPPFIVAKFT
ncbi:MAG: 3'(2'),5'-bisphosphate nucleotidase CysQ [Chitinophagales bacterium]|nr:3'(2'),5'-bisphosphate nucleotidase CysQ [Chitinophagales bacterium]MDW8419126.1 3'(2'),5'-bisphosphate nucleotidase CysQ [Chitinophagales bacterium]